MERKSTCLFLPLTGPANSKAASVSALLVPRPKTIWEYGRNFHMKASLRVLGWSKGGCIDLPARQVVAFHFILGTSVWAPCMPVPRRDEASAGHEMTVCRSSQGWRSNTERRTCASTLWATRRKYVDSFSCPLCEGADADASQELPSSEGEMSQELVPSCGLSCPSKGECEEGDDPG